VVLTGQGATSQDTAPTAQLDVSVVIVNYKVRDLLRDCLRSLEHDLAALRGEVWVVDNDSGDGSNEMVAAEFPWVRLIPSTWNRGYGAANNLAIRQARGRHVLILNPDTKLQPNALIDTLAVMDADPTIGALGPKLIRADGTLDRAWRSPSTGCSASPSCSRTTRASPATTCSTWTRIPRLTWTRSAGRTC